MRDDAVYKDKGGTKMKVELSTSYRQVVHTSAASLRGTQRRRRGIVRATDRDTALMAVSTKTRPTAISHPRKAWLDGAAAAHEIDDQNHHRDHE